MSEITDIPNHIAIIMDGNGRWAVSNGYDRSYGHLKGVDSVKAIVEESLEIGVKFLTMYAFSSENWGRPTKEVEYIMELFCSTVVDQKEILKKQGVKVLFMGESSQLSDKVKDYMSLCERETSENCKLTLVIALNYSSRSELVSAVKKIAQSVLNSEITLEQIDEKTVSNNLCIASLPDPDLIIRTSGECRLSNFMLWQASYSEFYFTDILWPDFGKKEYFEAISSYSRRARRFGKV